LSYSGRSKGDVKHIKKAFFIVILVLSGFIIGVVTMEILSRPVRRAYRETLQRNYYSSQRKLVFKALKEGDDLKAMVHLWTIMEMGWDGENLFKDEVSTSLDKTLSLAIPGINKLIKNLVHVNPEFKEWPKATPHGRKPRGRSSNYSQIDLQRV
jgi:hypothetical protein